MSRERVGERDVSEQVALAEQRGAVAFVVLGVGGSLGSWRHRLVSLATRPGACRLDYSVASPKTSRPLRVWPGFTTGPVVAGGELREHLGA